MPLGMTFDEWKTTPPDSYDEPDLCPSCRAELQAVHCDGCGWDACEDEQAALDRWADDKIAEARDR